MKNPITFIVLLIIFFSCNSKEENNSSKAFKNGVNLKISDSLAIAIPDSILPPLIDYHWNYDDKSLSYLYSDAESYYSLVNFDLKEKRWSKIKLQNEGPNGLRSKGQFKFVGNEIIFFPSTASSIFVSGLDGKIRSKFNYDTDFQVNAGPTQKINFVLKDSVIYFEAIYYNSLKEEDTFQNTKIVGVYDFKRDKFNTMINYPEEFHGEGWSSHDIDRNIIFQDDKIVVNFSKSHFLYIYDYEGNLIEKVEIRHPNVGDASGRSSADSFEQSLKHESVGSYSNLIYDNYRKVYYRIANFYGNGNVEILDLNDLKKAISKKKLGIITFNEYFEQVRISNFDFRRSGLVDYMTFVNEKGLHLKSVKEETSEEQLKFYILTF